MSLTKFRWWWTLFMVALTSAPYVMNWWSTPPGYHYLWILPPYPEDSFGYMAWARQAADGALLLKLKYTALPHAPFLFHPLFLVCGWLSALFSCDVAMVFFWMKALGVVIFLNAFYRYSDFLGLSAGESIVATILLGISSGLGGIFMLIGITNPWARLSTDLWMPEVSTFWSLLWNPLFPFSLATMLLSIFWMDRGTRDSRPADLWRSGLACAGTALLHPYSLPLLFILTVIVATVRQGRDAFAYLWRYFAAAAPFAIYVAAIPHFQPLVAQHSVTGQMKSPTPLEYVFGFGPLLVVVILGIVALRRQFLNRSWQLLVWFAAALALAYLPVWFQRKFVFGAQIPLTIVGALVVFSAFKSIRRRAGKSVATTLAIILLPVFCSTSIYILAQALREVRENRTDAYYLTDEMVNALDNLRERSRRDDVVLATISTSRLIPALCGDTAMWGHWAMSVDRQQREEQIRHILDVGSDLDNETRAREF